MALPVFIWVLLALFIVAGAVAFGVIIKTLISYKDGVFALWIERFGVNSSAKTEILQRDWSTMNYFFPTQNNERYEVRMLGTLNRVKFKTTIDRNDILPIDQQHCIIGVKELNKTWYDELSRKNHEITLLRGEADTLKVENIELKNQLDKLSHDRLKQAKDAVIIVPTIKKTSKTY